MCEFSSGKVNFRTTLNKIFFVKFECIFGYKFEVFKIKTAIKDYKDINVLRVRDLKYVKERKISNTNIHNIMI